MLAGTDTFISAEIINVFDIVTRIYDAVDVNTINVMLPTLFYFCHCSYGKIRNHRHNYEVINIVGAVQ